MYVLNVAKAKLNILIKLLKLKPFTFCLKRQWGLLDGALEKGRKAVEVVGQAEICKLTNNSCL